MSLIIKHIGKLLVTSALALSLVACVTVTESRITKKASPEKAVENYTELGLGYLERNRPDLARKRIEKALSIDSKYAPANDRSEEHTSELQSRPHLVCRLLLEKKKKKYS